MSIKRFFLALICLTLTIFNLSACAPTVVVAPEKTPQESASTSDTSDNAVKTGLSVLCTIDSSKGASADENGLAQADIMMFAVTIDESGVIDQCRIDALQTQIEFDRTGELLTDDDTVFASKNELGRAYGMHKASSIDKDWSEQIAVLADYAKGKTIEEIKGIALNDGGRPTDADLASSVTLYVVDYLNGIQAAAENAQELGASKGDALSLVSLADMDKSEDADEDESGLAAVSVSIAAITTNNGSITSSIIDAIEPSISFDTEGGLITDPSEPPLTKNQMAEDYGMAEASSIGKEWFEQAASFCAYIRGKTPAEVSKISINDDGKATEPDLAASVTISIADFQKLIQKTNT